MSHMLPHRCFTMHWISLAAHHYPFPIPMPSQSKVKQYQDHEVDFSVLSDRAFEVSGGVRKMSRDAVCGVRAGVW